MRIRFGRASFAWLSVSLVMYVAAVLLTMTVTWAKGGVLEHGERLVDASPTTYLTFLADGAAPPPGEDDVQISFFRDDRNPVLRAYFLNGAKVVMVTNRLRDAHACDQGGPGRKPMVEEVIGDRDAPVWYKVTSANNTMACKLRPEVSGPETFTTRSITLIADSDSGTLFPNDEMEKAAARGVPEKRAALEGLVPVPYILDLENLRGARDIRFHSYDTPTRQGEAWRVVRPSEVLTIRWTDVYRQQFRDILLIVIGTLIGIGVTVMIEGLRPVIEGLGGQKLAAGDQKGDPLAFPSSDQNSP